MIVWFSQPSSDKFCLSVPLASPLHLLTTKIEFDLEYQIFSAIISPSLIYVSVHRRIVIHLCDKLPFVKNDTLTYLILISNIEEGENKCKFIQIHDLRFACILF